jgi:RNA polymerase sigma factor (sigma-70 family)
MMFLEHKYTIDDLIRRCKSGERKAQELLYHRFASKMLGVCFRYAADRMEAEDMLQIGFIRVFEKIADYRGEGSFEGWVRRIMVHSSIEFYRKHHKMIHVADLEGEAQEQLVSPNITASLAAKDLMLLIQQLSPGYRIVFNLFAIEGYSHKEIAALTGITEGASKSQLSRARSLLKDQIVKMEGKKYGYAG